MLPGRPYNRYDPLAAIEAPTRTVGTADMTLFQSPEFQLQILLEMRSRYPDYVKPDYNYFHGSVVLDVECGDNHGQMYLSRFCQGSKGQCILYFRSVTDHLWLTPNQFQCISGRESAKDWKRSIRHQGKSLKLLLAKQILFVHPSSCACSGCRISSPVDRRKLSAYNFRVDIDPIGPGNANRSAEDYKGNSSSVISDQTDSERAFQEDLPNERWTRKPHRNKTPLQDISESSSEGVPAAKTGMANFRSKHSRDHSQLDDAAESAERYPTKKKRLEANSFASPVMDYSSYTSPENGAAKSDKRLGIQNSAPFSPASAMSNGAVTPNFHMLLNRLPFGAGATLPSFPAAYVTNYSQHFPSMFPSFGMYPDFFRSYSKSNPAQPYSLPARDGLENTSSSGSQFSYRSSCPIPPINDQSATTMAVDSMSSDTSGSSSPTSTLRRSNNSSTENSPERETPLDLTLARDTPAEVDSIKNHNCNNPPLTLHGKIFSGCTAKVPRFSYSFPASVIDGLEKNLPVKGEEVFVPQRLDSPEDRPISPTED
ncbi:uncharacterized protein LOC129588104 isoform X2 [Paramacrobiotus metropolitanus]|uniref:uncharacterized protein LOC129588104 isoform X2 n=1 Tax=Paramacrobiotus metropolitanus TaxID=2943436 RepID=UPI002446483E|nr:uncharacterized protein LOC129588104 isoform X2 [Paramacrobiotus metropolitanus]